MTSSSGTFTAEVLSPDGRLPVNIRKPDPGKVQVGFTAKVEGNFKIKFYHCYVVLHLLKKTLISKYAISCAR
jgi:hypothetical protein